MCKEKSIYMRTDVFHSLALSLSLGSFTIVLPKLINAGNCYNLLLFIDTHTNTLTYFILSVGILLVFILPEIEILHHQ